MSWKNSYYILLCMLLLNCNNEKKDAVDAVESNQNIAAGNTASKYIIEAEALKRIANSENVKIIDFRKPEAYWEGHIDGAINIWRNDIEDEMYPYKGMMAKKDSVAWLFSNLGITNNDQLIVYDDRGSCDAARLWWVLQNYDFDAVKILNGGLKAWRDIDGVINSEEVLHKESNFILPDNPSYRFLISKNELKSIILTEGPEIIIDTRTGNEYSGKRQKKGAVQGGRIPGSHRMDWIEAVDYHGTLKFKTKEELENIYGTFNVKKDHPIITYCHTGVRSAHTTFVLTQILGYTNVKNYDGSWTEWSFFENLPTIQDSITTLYK